MYVLNFIRGFCMALADSVPGVSGGTVAFILGFYDDFVNSVNNIISGDKIDRIRALKFLSKIVLLFCFIYIFYSKFYSKTSF